MYKKYNENQPLSTEWVKGKISSSYHLFFTHKKEQGLLDKDIL